MVVKHLCLHESPHRATTIAVFLKKWVLECIVTQNSVREVGG
jgi:hypothetical protein